MGVGLTLVRGLVEMHGGTIIPQSEGIGLGSRFTISLPFMDKWVSEVTGQGELTTTDLEQHKSMRSGLRFIKPFPSNFHSVVARFLLAPQRSNGDSASKHLSIFGRHGWILNLSHKVVETFTL
jgi:hypothetical protein